MADAFMTLAGYVFLAVFGILAIQFSIIIAAFFKKPTKYREIEPPVSIIIPAYNEESVIAETVQCLIDSDYPEEKTEIIVVDDGSTDRTLDILKGFKGVKLLRKNHEGKVAALNHGIKKAKNEILVTIDADTRVDRNFIRKIVQPFSDKSVGGVASPPRVANPKGVLGIFQNLEYIYNTLIRDSFCRIASSSIIGFGGALAAYRKPVLEKIGGFSADTVTEDFDVAVQIERAGYKTICQKEAIGYTTVPSSFSQLLKQRVRWAKGGLQTITKNRDMISLKYGWAIIFVFLSYAFWLIYPVLSLPVIGYQMLFWLPYNLGSLFDAGFYLFRWFSLAGPLYAIYMVPIWGISFFTIFGILSGIFSGIITGAGIFKYDRSWSIKKYLAIFFYFPYILVLNLLMLGGLANFLKKRTGNFIK